MRHFLLFLLACGGLMTAHADDKTVVMNVKTSSGVTPIEVTAQSRIVFSDDLATMIMTADSDAQPQTFSVDDIAQITFELKSTSVANFTADDLSIKNEGGILTISGADTIVYGVWSVSGVSVMSGTARDAVSIDFNSLQRGVYIIKANKTTLKYTNQ